MTTQARLYPTEREEQEYRKLKEQLGLRDSTIPQSLPGDPEARMTSSKWLTPDEKAQHVAEWVALRQAPGLDAPDRGGLGFPDPEIFELTDRLNAMVGICTVQSCAGHKPRPQSGWYKGQLWIRPTYDVYTVFVRGAPFLERCDLIEQFSVLWKRHECGPVIDIIFDGNETGSLDQSAEFLVEFFHIVVGHDDD